jgi:predicted TIM-barrel fold metal-dependent hydrolase
MANEVGRPIFLHPPAEPVGSDSLADFRLVEQVGRFMDVTVGLAALVFGGRLEQYPDLRFVAATAGGAISLLAGRLDSAYAPRHWGGPPKGGDGPPSGRPPMAQFENKISEPPSKFLASVYVDTANSSVPNHLANLELMGADHLLFGSDSPPLSTPLPEAIATVENLPISDQKKRQILEGNARRLFGLDSAASA